MPHFNWNKNRIPKLINNSLCCNLEIKTVPFLHFNVTVWGKSSFCSLCVSGSFCEVVIVGCRFWRTNLRKPLQKRVSCRGDWFKYFEGDVRTAWKCDSTQFVRGQFSTSAILTHHRTSETFAYSQWRNICYIGFHEPIQLNFWLSILVHRR